VSTLPVPLVLRAVPQVLRAAALVAQALRKWAAVALGWVALRAAVPSDGSTPCSQRYTANNSLLDALVGGCSIGSGIFSVPALTATQPDTADPNVTNPGSGAPYRLVPNSARVVDVCRDKNNASVNLSDCLAAAAYSSAFELTTDRVIVK
jgi:hypothetical protein